MWGIDGISDIDRAANDEHFPIFSNMNKLGSPKVSIIMPEQISRDSTSTTGEFTALNLLVLWQNDDLSSTVDPSPIV